MDQLVCACVVAIVLNHLLSTFPYTPHTHTHPHHSYPSPPFTPFHGSLSASLTPFPPSFSSSFVSLSYDPPSASPICRVFSYPATTTTRILIPYLKPAGTARIITFPLDWGRRWSPSISSRKVPVPTLLVRLLVQSQILKRGNKADCSRLFHMTTPPHQQACPAVGWSQHHNTVP